MIKIKKLVLDSDLDRDNDIEMSISYIDGNPTGEAYTYINKDEAIKIVKHLVDTFDLTLEDIDP
jgi:hypothetical protein